MSEMPSDAQIEHAAKVAKEAAQRLRDLRAQRADVIAGEQKIARVIRKRCKHRPIRDFKVGDEWRCTECGRTGKWGDGWEYFGAFGCRKCGDEPAIEAVTCSEACRQKFDAAIPVELR
jgi:hypothetical protein